MSVASLDHPPQQISWDDIIWRAEAATFGDLLIESEEMHKRGPLLKMEHAEHRIKFHTPWMACRYVGSEIWENHNDTGLFVSDELRPTINQEGTITFFVPRLSKIQLLPRSMFNAMLDSAKVRGLAPASERLLALFPGLAFNREAAIRALKDFPLQRRSIEKLGPDAGLENVRKLFKYDSTLEEFLWNYIEEVTGEKNLHLRIY